MKESVEEAAQEANSSGFSATASHLLHRFQEELEQAENYVQFVQQNLENLGDASTDGFALFDKEFHQIGVILVDLIGKLTENPNPESLSALSESAQELLGRVEFLDEELKNSGTQADNGSKKIERFTSWITKFVGFVSEVETGETAIAEEATHLELKVRNQMDQPLTTTAVANNEELISSLESLATLLLESESMQEYEQFIGRVSERAVELSTIHAELADLALELQEIYTSEHTRLNDTRDNLRNSIKELVWLLDTNSAADACLAALNAVEQQKLAYHGDTIQLIGGKMRQAVRQLDELSNDKDSSDSSQQIDPNASEYEEEAPTQAISYATPDYKEENPMNQPTSTSSYSSGSQELFDDLQNKIFELEQRLSEKVDKRDLLDQSVSSISEQSNLQTEVSRMRRRISELEDLSSMPGELNDSLVMKQLGQLGSEVNVLEKQTKLLLTDLNQKVESAVLKGELNARLREMPNRDQLREIENILRDKQSELSSDLKALRGELSNRPNIEQLRKVTREIFQDERQAEEFVERYELKSIETALDQLSERVSKKVEVNTIEEKVQGLVSKDDLRNEVKLLELHKNETRLFLSEMQEKIKTIPDYDNLVSTFVKAGEFDDQIKRKNKAIGELRLDIDVATERSNNAISKEQLDTALKQLQIQLDSTDAFISLEARVNEIQDRLVDVPAKEELDQLGKVVKVHSEHISRLPEESAVDAMIRAKVEELENRTASKEIVEVLHEQFNLLETDVSTVRNHHESLQEVLRVIQNDIQDLDINKESFIANFNEELKDSLFKMISEYDESLQHDLEAKLKEWNAYQETIKDEQLASVLKYLNEEVYEATNEFKERMERNVSEHIITHAKEFKQATNALEELSAEKRDLMDEVRRARKDLTEIEYLKKENLREFKDELRKAKSEIFDTSESSMRQYYDEQLDKLRHSYEEKNEQILELLGESRGDWFSQNLMGIIAVILSGIAITLGINSLL